MNKFLAYLASNRSKKASYYLCWSLREKNKKKIMVISSFLLEIFFLKVGSINYAIQALIESTPCNQLFFSSGHHSVI